MKPNSHSGDLQYIVAAFRHLLWLMVAAILLASCGKAVKEQALPPGSPVVALGDSLTAGAGVNPEQAWPVLLAKRTGWAVINGGVSGDTSAEALRRLPSLLEQHKPVLVLVTLGGNDMLRHIPRQETVANLGQMLTLIKAQGAKAVLLATPEPSIAGAVLRRLSAADFYREVGKQYQVPLIEDAIPEVLSDPQLKGDPLHPNVEGHELLSGKIFDALKEIGYAR
jgi:acyl-CoA thioesterase-1